MIAQASLVAKGVLLLLLCMSIMSWGLMIQKYIALTAANKKALAGTGSLRKPPTCVTPCSPWARIPLPPSTI